MTGFTVLVAEILTKVKVWLRFPILYVFTNFELFWDSHMWDSVVLVNLDHHQMTKRAICYDHVKLYCS